MHRLCPSLLFVLLSMTAICQIEEDFSDGTFANWIGDINNFIVNAEGQLQLMDVDAGSSQLFIPLEFSDSIQWSLDLELDFSPSLSNAVEILSLIHI